MPLLGEAVELARALGVNPWWRAVAALESKPHDERTGTSEELPTLPPAADGQGVEWPLD